MYNGIIWLISTTFGLISYCRRARGAARLTFGRGQLSLGRAFSSATGIWVKAHRLTSLCPCALTCIQHNPLRRAVAGIKALPQSPPGGGTILAVGLLTVVELHDTVIHDSTVSGDGTGAAIMIADDVQLRLRTLLISNSAGPYDTGIATWR